MLSEFERSFAAPMQNFLMISDRVYSANYGSGLTASMPIELNEAQGIVRQTDGAHSYALLSCSVWAAVSLVGAGNVVRASGNDQMFAQGQRAQGMSFEQFIELPASHINNHIFDVFGGTSIGVSPSAEMRTGADRHASAWAMVALGGAFTGLLGMALSLVPSFQDAAALVPVGALVWWFVGEFGPKSTPNSENR